VADTSADHVRKTRGESNEWKERFRRSAEGRRNNVEHRRWCPELYDTLFSRFEGLGFRPRVDETHDGLHTLWQLVASERGWAIGFASQ
jgi:hypothetical protein